MSASHLIALLMAMGAPDAAPVAPAEAPAAAAAPVESARVETARANPPKMICRKIEEIGSRLRANKVCMTSSEWAEQRRIDRMNVDRSQRTRWTQGN